MTDKLSKGESLPHLSRREAMTQDEREQKALEAAREFAHNSAMAAEDQLYPRPFGQEDFENALMRKFHAAMTEGGVWISREDARHIVTMSDYTHYGHSATCGDPLAEKEVCDRLRAKLEGNHDL
jgi:hypothetical protein